MTLTTNTNYQVDICFKGVGLADFSIEISSCVAEDEAKKRALAMAKQCGYNSPVKKITAKIITKS